MRKITVGPKTNVFPRILIHIDCGEMCAKYRVVQKTKDPDDCDIEQTIDTNRDAMGVYIWKEINGTLMMDALAYEMYLREHGPEKRSK